MITLDKIILNSLVERNLKSLVSFGNKTPAIKDVYTDSTDEISNLFNPMNIPEIPFGSISSVSSIKVQTDKIALWLQSAGTALGYVITEHQALSNRYQALCERINNEMEVFNQALSAMLNYSCHYIFPLKGKQDRSSNVGNIGKFITLPYFLESCKMHNGSIFIRASSSGDIIFSNMEGIGSIPFTDLPSIKVMDINNNVYITVTVSFEEMSLNAVYAKFLNERVIIDIGVYNGTTLIYKGSQASSEVLFNFLPLKATSIAFKIAAVNTNPSKPFSLQIGALELFNQIVFAQYGAFISTPYEIGEINKINTLSLAHKNDGDITSTNSIQYLSVQTDPADSNFARVDVESKLDVSSYKYKYGITLDGFNRDLVSDDVHGHMFYKYLIPRTSPEVWNMDVKNAIIYFGTNRSYAMNAGNIENLSDPYENWTRVGNYYKTQIANYEDNVQINIGDKVCILNGRNITGIFYMPIGISTLEVHVKDMDFKFGGVIEDNKYNGIASASAVSSDPLYPNNLLYIFGGMPEYESGTLSGTLTERQIPVSSTSSIFLNEPFIPMSMSVYDSKGRSYTLVISRSPSIPGTFSIEPNKGRVRICPYGSDMFRLTYRKCSLGTKPAGVLFNRLLTFMPMKTLVNMLNYNTIDQNLFETYFTLDGNQNERWIMFPDIKYATNRNISHAILSYNLQTDKMYSSVKVDLTSTDKYLTPIVNNIYVTGN